MKMEEQTNTVELGQGLEEAAAVKPAEPVNGYWWGTGRRKSSVASVRIREGSGKILVNGRSVDDFFHQQRDRNAVRAPLIATDKMNGFDVLAKVRGGGFTGQAGAVVLGIARALRKMDPRSESNLRSGGFLTRDPRMKERKKYGLRGARRSFQFSKR